MSIDRIEKIENNIKEIVKVLNKFYIEITKTYEDGYMKNIIVHPLKVKLVE